MRIGDKRSVISASDHQRSSPPARQWQGSGGAECPGWSASTMQVRQATWARSTDVGKAVPVSAVSVLHAVSQTWSSRDLSLGLGTLESRSWSWSGTWDHGDSVFITHEA